ncbi:protein RCC2 homolog [Pectinophora gossypiella]|uniref:protein RCC2 homolog n=1 Tax=Pectinophora gossypiella TaxID=13191 RepID=UPI00214EA5E0|nr:protein RCC2 homolog [Pectinophora gossypiella]
MILDCNGALHSFGLPEYGQLGHNTDGKYFVTSTKLSFHFETVPKHVAMFFEKTKDGHVMPVKDVDIVDFSCGNNHTVAIDSKKRAFSWGFGGFGRLGHAEQKDESVPRLIKYFDSSARGVRSVHCGATYSLAVNELGEPSAAERAMELETVASTFEDDTFISGKVLTDHLSRENPN